MTDTLTTLSDILDESAKLLLAKIKDGTATAADLNVARALLKDNGINAIPTKTNGLGGLADSLPFQSAEDIGQTYN